MQAAIVSCNIVCVCLEVPHLARLSGMHGLLSGVISVDLHSFLECQTTSAFPAAAEVIGSWSQADACRNAGGYAPPHTHLASRTHPGTEALSAGWWSDMGFVMGCDVQVELHVRSTRNASRAPCSPNPSDCKWVNSSRISFELCCEGSSTRSSTRKRDSERSHK